MYMGNTDTVFDNLAAVTPEFQKMLSLVTETEGTVVVSWSAGPTQPTKTLYWVSPQYVPWDDAWPTGNITLELDVHVGAFNITGKWKVHRYNAGGTLQESSALSSAISLRSAGVKSYTYTSEAWSAGNYGDRIVVAFAMDNSSSNARSVTIGIGTTDSQATFSGLVQGSPGPPSMMGCVA